MPRILAIGQSFGDLLKSGTFIFFYKILLGLLNRADVINPVDIPSNVLAGEFVGVGPPCAERSLIPENTCSLQGGRSSALPKVQPTALSYQLSPVELAECPENWVIKMLGRSAAACPGMMLQPMDTL